MYLTKNQYIQLISVLLLIIFFLFLSRSIIRFVLDYMVFFDGNLFNIFWKILISPFLFLFVVPILVLSILENLFGLPSISGDYWFSYIVYILCYVVLSSVIVFLLSSFAKKKFFSKRRIVAGLFIVYLISVLGIAYINS